MVELVVHGIVHGAQRTHAVLDIRDRHVPVRDSAQKIVRAVDRVDDPQPFGIAGERRGGFLAEKMIAGKRARNLAANERLDVAVGDADKILRPFELDRQRGAAQPEVARERAGVACEMAQEIVARVERHLASTPRD